MDGSFYENENKDKGFRIAITSLKTVVRILIMIFIVLAIIYAARRIYKLGYEAFSVRPVAENADEGKDVTVVIKRNMSLREIAELLNENGLIDESEIAFVIQANAYGYAKTIKPGPYVLNTSMSVQEMLEFMSKTDEEEEEEG